MDKKDRPVKKLECKKSVVRNTVQRKPKTVILLESEASQNIQKLKEKSISSVSALLDTAIKPVFEAPELNSALRIAKKISMIETTVKPTKVKSVVEIQKNKRTILEEKASKQVNFPYAQHIYKDLIPLCTRTQPLPSVPSKEIIIHKDKEPSLADFYEPKRMTEYKFQVPTQTSQRSLIRQFDGLKLYRTLKTLN